MKTISIAINESCRDSYGGAAEVDVKTYGPADLLAVHKTLDVEGYTVTHVASKMRVLSTRTLKGAKEARAALLQADGWDSPVIGTPFLASLAPIVAEQERRVNRENL